MVIMRFMVKMVMRKKYVAIICQTQMQDAVFLIIEKYLNNLSYFFNTTTYLFLFTPKIGWNLTHIFGRVFKNKFRSVNHQNQLSFNQF